MHKLYKTHYFPLKIDFLLKQFNKKYDHGSNNAIEYEVVVQGQQNRI
jgi:hypothetical protein